MTNYTHIAVAITQYILLWKCHRISCNAVAM